MTDPTKEFSYEDVKQILCKHCEIGANFIRKNGSWYHPRIDNNEALNPLVLCSANEWRNKTCGTTREQTHLVDVTNGYPSKVRITFRKPMVELRNMLVAEAGNWYGTFHEKTLVEGEGVVDFILVICKQNNGEPIHHKYRLNDVKSIEVLHEG